MSIEDELDRLIVLYIIQHNNDWTKLPEALEEAAKKVDLTKIKVTSTFLHPYHSKFAEVIRKANAVIQKYKKEKADRIKASKGKNKFYVGAFEEQVRLDAEQYLKSKGKSLEHLPEAFLALSEKYNKYPRLRIVMCLRPLLYSADLTQAERISMKTYRATKKLLENMQKQRYQEAKKLSNQKRRKKENSQSLGQSGGR